MMRSFVIFACSVLCILAGCSSPGRDTAPLDLSDAPYRFVEKESYTTNNSCTHFVDLDGAGIESRVVMTCGTDLRQSSVVTTRYNGTTISQISLPVASGIEYQLARDINNDGFKELFLVSRNQDSLFLTIVNVYASGVTSPVFRRYPLSISADTLTRFYSDETVRLVDLVDGADKRSPVIIASYTPGLSHQSSVLFGINALTGKLLWQYPMGPRPEFASASPAAQHDGSELYFGTTSSGTAALGSGMDDAHTYLVGLRSSGEPLWKPRVLGGAFATSKVYLYDVNGDGESELVCFFSSSNRQVEKSYMKIFDPRNGAQVGSTKEFNERIILSDELPVVSRKHEKFFVVCTYAGTVSLIKKDFETVLERRLPAEVLGLQVKNITGNDDEEIIVSLRNDRTLILDQQLAPVTVISGNTRISVSRCNAGTEPMIVVENGKNVIAGSLLPMSGLAQGLLLWAGAGLGCILLAVVTYRGLLYVNAFRTATSKSRIVSILLLTSRGRIVLANAAFCSNFSTTPQTVVGRRWSSCLTEEYQKPLRDLLARVTVMKESPEEQVDLFTPGFSGSVLARSHPVYLGPVRLGTFVALHDITQVLKSDRMVSWAMVAHNMAHEMKTPLSTIWFTLARIRQEIADGAGAQVEGRLESIEEEVRRVDNYLKGFMKLANINPPNVGAIDVNAAIEEVLESYREKLPETTAITLDLAQGLPPVQLDVNLFTVALRNLFDNAVTAMKGKGVLKVSTYLVRNLMKNSVYLALSDTGCGIREKDLPKVFQPYYSTSEGGTGLGLLITKKIVEDHEGSITFTSREGFGTEFIVQFPVSDHIGGGTSAS